MLRSLILLFLLSAGLVEAQQLKIDDLIRFPTMDPEEVGNTVIQLGWSRRNLEFVTDSNLIRRTWEVQNRKNGVKEFLISYEFPKDSAEAYCIYQFSDKTAFVNYKTELKDRGFKLLSAGKQKRKKKSDTHKEKDDLFFNESRNMLIVVKEVFLYGLNSFLIYSYKPGSPLAKHTISSKSTADH